MHHQLVIIDFDKHKVRVYPELYHFLPTDLKNGEYLLLVRDQKVAVSYMIEALRIFDPCHFRVAQKEAKKAKEVFCLSKPSRNSPEKA